jgi:hypothetical protein
MPGNVERPRDAGRRPGPRSNTDTRTTGAPRCWSEKVDRNAAIRSLTSAYESVLYAVRMPDGIIKIGCTRDLGTRLSQLGACEVLGFHEGNRSDELEIHHSLIAHRARHREWYHPTPEVFAVVNAMRDDFGLPHLAA